jgi:hypothetical protein
MIGFTRPYGFFTIHKWYAKNITAIIKATGTLREAVLIQKSLVTQETLHSSRDSYHTTLAGVSREVVPPLIHIARLVL